MHSAVKENNEEKLEYLLGQLNVDLNYRDEVTALYLSLQLLRSDSFIIRLIEAGCDPNLTTVNNDTALHLAVNRLTTKVALKLIEKGADVNAVDAYYRTPLHYAVKNNNLESVCLLLYHGANVNFEDLNNETPIDIALRYESFEIISVLVGYYDTSALFLSLTSQRDQFVVVKLKLIFYLLSEGAQVNYMDRQGSNLLLFSIYDSNDKLFKFIWSKIDHTIFLDSRDLFLTNYILFCNFPSSQWLECLYLMLESPAASKLIKHQHDELGSVLEALDNKKIEPKDVIAIIYLFLSLGCHTYNKCFNIVYQVYGYREELEALIYCSSRNICIHKYSLCSLNLRLIALPLKVEPDTQDLLQWLKDTIEMSDCNDDETVIKEITNTLGFFWLPARMKAKLFDLFEESCEIWGDISKILNEGLTVPSLRELSRNQSRKYIKEKFNIERTYQFYDVLKTFKLPQLIYDIICFKKPIYYIRISQQPCADVLD